MLSLDDVTKTIAGIPSAVKEWVIFPGLIILTFAIWQLTTRVTALEQERAVTEAQRAAEIRAIDDLSKQVGGMREDQQKAAREQLDWLVKIFQGRK